MAGHSAYGTLLGTATSASMLDLTTNPSSWTYIGDLTGIGGPNMSVDTIDVTAHDSTGGFREFVAGLIDGGDITFEGNLLTAAAGDEIIELAEERANVLFIVKFPTSGTIVADANNREAWLLAGSVVGFETNAPHDGKIGFSASIKLTGQPFLTSTYTTTT